jgi:hypothetical protein
MGPATLSKFLMLFTLSTPFSATIDEITFDGNPITGSVTTHSFIGSETTYDVDVSVLAALGVAMQSSTISKLSFAGCQMGTKGLIKLSDAISLSGALSEVKLSFPNGKPLTLVKGMTEINVSKLGLKPVDVEFLAIFMTLFWKFTGAVKNINLSSNNCFGADWMGHTVDKDQTGWRAICEAFHFHEFTAIETLVLSDIGAGPVALSTLADAMSGMGAIKLLNIASNNCFGTQDKGRYDSTKVRAVDKDQTGWRAICEALKGTTIETLVFSDIGAGPVALSTLADAMSDIGAVNEILLDKNPITVEQFNRIGILEDRSTFPFYRSTGTVDSDLSGLSAICDAMSSRHKSKFTDQRVHRSPISKFSISGCNIGPAGLSTLAWYGLAKFIPDIGTLSEVNLRGATIKNS